MQRALDGRADPCIVACVEMGTAVAVRASGDDCAAVRRGARRDRAPACPCSPFSISPPALFSRRARRCCAHSPPSPTPLPQPFSVDGNVYRVIVCVFFEHLKPPCTLSAGSDHSKSLGVCCLPYKRVAFSQAAPKRAGTSVLCGRCAHQARPQNVPKGQKEVLRPFVGPKRLVLAGELLNP